MEAIDELSYNFLEPYKNKHCKLPMLTTHIAPGHKYKLISLKERNFKMRKGSEADPNRQNEVSEQF
jgi:hypothetical protein